MITGDTKDWSMKKEFPESKSTLLRFIDTEHNFRVRIIPGSALGMSLADAHGLRGRVRELFMHAVHATALLSADLKQTVRMVLQAKWEDAGFSLEGHWDGHVRGYMRGGDELEARLDADPAMAGSMSVIRLIGSHPGYTGYAAIFGFNLRSALEGYFQSSEQRESHFLFQGDFSAMIEAMPGENVSRDINLKQMLDQIGNTLKNGDLDDPQKLAEQLNREHELGLKFLGGEAKDIYCPCTREKISVYLQGLDPKELHSMYDEGPWPVRVNCHNCGSQYAFQRDDIETFLKNLSSDHGDPAADENGEGE